MSDPVQGYNLVGCVLAVYHVPTVNPSFTRARPRVLLHNNCSCSRYIFLRLAFLFFEHDKTMSSFHMNPPEYIGCPLPRLHQM